MPERTFHVGFFAVLAWALWLKAGVDVALAAHTGNHIWAACGIVCAAGAGTLHVRSFFAVFSARMKECFLLGREVERREQAQRELHSV